MQSQSPPDGSDWTGIWFGLGIALLAAYQQFKLPPVLPEMLDRFAYGEVLAGGFMSIFAGIGLVTSLKIGQAMQRQSTAAWLIGACVLIGVGAVPILALPENGWAVMAGRALEGIAMAILAVAGPTLMTRNAAPRHVPIAAAIAATWVPLGGLLGAAVARAADSFALSGGTWPAVWWVGLVFAAAMAFWTLILARGDGRRLALPTAKGGAPDLTAADRRALILVAVCFCFWALQNIAVFSWLPEYLNSARGLGDAAAKELYGLTAITVALFNLLAALFLRYVPIALLLAIVLAGQASVLVVGPLAGTDWTGILVLIAYGAFAGVTPTCLFGLPGLLLGPGGRGPAAFGFLLTGRNLGVLCGPLLVGWIGGGAFMDAFGWTTDPWMLGWWTAAASAVLALIAAALIHRGRRGAGQGTSL